MVDRQEVVMENKSTKKKLQDIHEFYSDGKDEDLLMMLSKDACNLVSAAMSVSEVLKSKKTAGIRSIARRSTISYLRSQESSCIKISFSSEIKIIASRM